MRALQTCGWVVALLTLLLGVSVPAKRYFETAQHAVWRDAINVSLARRTAAVAFLNRRVAASQYYQMLAVLYCSRLAYPHYHLLGQDDHNHAGDHDHSGHDHHGHPDHNAAGEPYVGYTHAPGGDIPLTARDIAELDARARYIDSHVEEFIDIEYFYDLIGLAHALDPDNEDVLEFGRAWILNRRMAERTAGELLAAYARRPGWRSLFEAGWVTLYHLGDAETARRHLRQASHEPGAPPYVAGIYACSFYADRKHAAAMQQLAAEIEATSDHTLRTRLEQRRLWYRDLFLLNQAARTFRERTGRPIERPDELVTAGLIATIPDDTLGGGFVWDARHEEIVSRDAVPLARRMP